MKLTRSEAMKLRHSVARVDKWLSLATDQDLADGLAWYDRARGMAEEMAAESGHICQWCGTHKENPLGMCSKCGRFPVRHCAGVIAALSPRQQWGTNVAGAWRMLRAAAAGEDEPVVAGLSANRSKAWSIAQGADPDAVLSGPKVRAFYANIMGDVDAVTVDIWAARAAEGRENPHAPQRRRYRLLSESYRRAGERRGMCPRDVQAAVWTVYRRHARLPVRPRDLGG